MNVDAAVGLYAEVSKRLTEVRGTEPQWQFAVALAFLAAYLGRGAVSAGPGPVSRP